MTAKLIASMKRWYNGNLAKNNGQKEERKGEQASLKEFEKEYKSRNAPFEVEIDDTLSLEAGYFTEESEAIDPKKLFDRDPEAFWKLVNVPKTNAIEMLGEAVVAKISVTTKKTSFKIKKIKKEAKVD